MKNQKNIFWVLVLLCTICVTLSSCGPNLGAVYQRISVVPDSVGVVYIYRPDRFVASKFNYAVRKGDTVITTLYNGSYYPYYCKPGINTFWAKTEARSEAMINVKPGNSYYLRGTVTMGVWVGRPSLEEVDPAVAEEEIIDCQIIPEEERRIK